MAKSSLFLAGVPTTLEVNELSENIHPEPGTSATYERITEIIGVKADTNRFRTCVRRWRSKLRREKGIQTRAGGGAVHFLTADAAVEENSERMRGAGRAVGRAVRDLGMVRQEELSTEEKRSRHRLLVREGAAILESHRAAAKRLAEPAPKAVATLRIAK